MNEPEDIADPKLVTEGTLRLRRKKGMWLVEIAEYSTYSKRFVFWELYRSLDRQLAVECYIQNKTK